MKHVTHWQKELEEALGKEWHVHCVESSGSTMDEARRELTRAPDASKMVVISRIQRRGRGRVGRTWYSAPGALLATYAFAYTGTVQKLVGLPLAVGVVIAELCETLGASVVLKWPNDLMSEQEEKLGGLLVETVSGKSVLVGIGINLDGVPDLPPKITSKVTSLNRIGGQAVSPAEFAALLAPRLEQALQVFVTQGFRTFRQRWERRALWVGEKIRVECGDETISGKLLSVDSSGALLVEQGKDVRMVVAGDVIRIRAEARAIGA